MRTAITNALDVVGVFLLAACAYFVWAPAALGVLGVACLAGSWQHATPPASVLVDDGGEL